MFLLLSPAWAICDDPIFSIIPAPPPTDERHGVATGMGTLSGKDVLGGRFSLDSALPPSVWKNVLLHAENQDEWVPKQFGYEFSEWIDREHMYLRFNIGFLANTIHVKRQLVVQVASGDVGDRFRTCWKMVDPTPHMSRITAWISPDVNWERASTGWWEVTPKSDGGALINYQWWAETGAMPTAIMRAGISGTLPDLLDAFEARVKSLTK